MKVVKEAKSLRLGIRTTPTERRALGELARLEQSNLSAVLCRLIREAAQEKGLLPTQNSGGGND